MQEIVIENVTIKKCILCNIEHRNVSVFPLNKPIEEYKFYALCPIKNEPIYLKFLNH